MKWTTEKPSKPGFYWFRERSLAILVFMACLGCDKPSRPMIFCWQDDGGYYATDRPWCDPGEVKVTAKELEELEELLNQYPQTGARDE